MLTLSRMGFRPITICPCSLLVGGHNHPETKQLQTDFMHVTSLFNLKKKMGNKARNYIYRYVHLIRLINLSSNTVWLAFPDQLIHVLRHTEWLVSCPTPPPPQIFSHDVVQNGYNSRADKPVPETIVSHLIGLPIKEKTGSLHAKSFL